MKALWITALLVLTGFVQAEAAPESGDATDSQGLLDILNAEPTEPETQSTSWTPISRQSQSSDDDSFLGTLIQGFLDFLNNWSSGSDSPSESDDSSSYGRSGFAKGEPLHDQATSAIANAISFETGASADNYQSYASKLADTLGNLNSAALGRVLEDDASKLP